MKTVLLNINKRVYSVTVKEHWTLLYVLREILHLTGTKNGCDSNDCGACKVIVDGTAVNSCHVPVTEVEGKQIETIEGLAINGVLHPIQQAFIDCGAVQCGFCTPGMIMTAKALLDKNPDPTEDEIRDALAGNLCRCTGYYPIIEAIRSAAIQMKGHGYE